WTRSRTIPHGRRCGLSRRAASTPCRANTPRSSQTPAIRRRLPTLRKSSMAMHLDGGHRTAARLTALTLLAGLCALAFLLSIGAGAVNLSLGEVWRALFVETSGVRRQIV